MWPHGQCIAVAYGGVKARGGILGSSASGQKPGMRDLPRLGIQNLRRCSQQRLRCMSAQPNNDKNLQASKKYAP